MDSRRCSAALGFTLLIGCVIGIVMIIYNSGTTRRSLETSGANPSGQHNQNHHHPHHHRTSSTKVVGGKSGGDHFVSTHKDGFVNDPNYRSSQPTMQEVNELADELRLLSSKSKHVLGNSPAVNSGTVSSMKKTNGTLTSASSSATSSAKATISAVNYSNVPKKGSFGPPSAPGATLPTLPVPTNFPFNVSSSAAPRNPPFAPSAVSRQEAQGNYPHNPYLPSHQEAHPGQQTPSSWPPIMPRRKISPSMVDNNGERHINPGLPYDKTGRGGGGGLAQGDLYTVSWHPSMALPAGGSMANHPYHHPPSSSSSHRRPNGSNNPQQTRASSSPAKINKSGKGARYPLNQNQQNQPPNPKQSQHGYHRDQRQDHEKEEMMKQEEDGDFVYTDAHEEDDVSGNLGNLKKEEEWYDDNDIPDADDNEEDEDEEDEEEEEDEEDNGANPGFLMEPKNLAADLETLVSLANHLYTSPASLLSAFFQAKNNSTKKAEAATLALSPTGFPVAFQGFLKVVNETLQRSNNSKLLVELNELYKGRGARMTGASGRQHVDNNNTTSSSSGDGASTKTDIMKNSETKSETPYEKSLTAFVFMSFGVFLLNQIHSFIQQAADEHLQHHKLLDNNTVVGEGRSLPWELEEGGLFSWYSPRSPMLMSSESSSLDILFQPPVSSTKGSLAASNSSSDSVSGRSSDVDASPTTEGHVNNMFRALLNIANAYTKDSPELECIWSLYCQDLDQTSHKKGLYGVAARINSVGLRLIMRQIPPALTFDVILRSLVGWDGLPCRKMFPACSVQNGTMSLETTDKEDEVVTNGV